MHHSKNPIIAIVLVAICFLFTLPLFWFYDKPVHVSIDDVGMCLDDLQKNENSFSSVFDQPFFHSIQKLHDITGVNITLYVYARYGDYTANHLPERYVTEINKNSDWLRLGFHANRPTIVKDSIENLLSFINGYNLLVENGLGGKNQKLRLECFHATQDEVDYLKRNGVNVLFSADDDRISYSLPIVINEKLREKESLHYNGMKYEMSDIRIEKTLFPIIDLLKNRNDKEIIIFTHEWALHERVNRYKLFITVLFLSIYQCKYVL